MAFWAFGLAAVVFLLAGIMVAIYGVGLGVIKLTGLCEDRLGWSPLDGLLWMGRASKLKPSLDYGWQDAYFRLPRDKRAEVRAWQMRRIAYVRARKMQVRVAGRIWAKALAEGRKMNVWIAWYEADVELGLQERFGAVIGSRDEPVCDGPGSVVDPRDAIERQRRSDEQHARQMGPPGWRA